MAELSDFASSHAAAGRFKRLRLGVVVLGASVILAFVGSTGYDVYRSYHHALTATERELRNVADALAEQTAWIWQAVDLLLVDTARWYRNDSAAVAPGRLNEVLANRTAGLRQVYAVTIIDAQGVPRYRSAAPLTPVHDVSDRSYFLAQRDGRTKGLFISEPLLTRSEGRAAVVLSRRLEDDDGRFAGVVTANVALEQLEQFYGAVNLGSGSAVQLIRDDGTLLVRNPPSRDVVGATFSQFGSGAHSSDVPFANPLDGKRDFVAVARVRGTPTTLAVTRQAAVALQPWRDEAIRTGVRTVIVALLGMLTLGALLRQLRRVETMLRAQQESEERYALAMQGANEGHWDWDIAADRLYLSPRMKSLGGVAEDSVINSRADWVASITIHPDDAARFEATVRNHLDGRTPRYECEYRVRHAGGEWRWLQSRGTCLRDAQGTAWRFVGSAIDITAEKQAQADKELLEAQLGQSQKMEAIGTLAGGIAHDFNNILGAIVGYGELAQEHATPGGATRRYVDEIMHAAERARGLVDLILGFSRSGLAERIPVHVESVVEETLALLVASLPVNVRVDRLLAAGNAAVLGDATRLHQVAFNLCTNAVQAMERGGVLTVHLERVGLTEPRPLTRGSVPEGSYVRLIVGDTGTGIPDEVLERMFDPFFTTKGVGQGTGLGLSLVHGIVADFDGAIDVATKPGEGTEFVVWLPVAGEVDRPGADVVRDLPHGGGETVMIVDDERVLVALGEEMLAELGYEPVGMDSSSAALRAFQSEPNRFDLVLTDEAMPHLAGTELAREIRRLRPTIPVVLMSGHAGPELAQRAVACGIAEVLRKPLRRRDLAESLARVLEAGR